MTIEAAGGRDLGQITEISTIRWAEQPNLLWVQVRTSAGVTGLGETYYLPGAVESVIRELAAPLLLGQPAGSIRKAWTTLFSCANFFGFAGAEMRAISALDIALWDALGQAVGLPVYQLLGGACRTSVPAYNTCVNAGPYQDWDLALADPGALASQLVAEGYLGLKVWPWDRFAPQIEARGSTGPAGWTAMGPPGSYLSQADLAAGLAMLEQARDASGDRIELLVEGHSRWDLNMAIRIARAVEPLRRAVDGGHLPAGQRRGPGPAGPRDPRAAGGQRAADHPLPVPRDAPAPGRARGPDRRGLDRRAVRGPARSSRSAASGRMLW